MSDVAGLITAAVAVLVAMAGYVQFVLRRSIYPCIEFDVDLVDLNGSANAQSVGEVALSILNKGPGVGFVVNVQGRVRYRTFGESRVGRDGLEPGFEHSLATRGEPADPGPGGGGAAVKTVRHASHILGKRAFPFVDDQHSRNFIQPGVTQRYRKPLVFPENVELIHVWGAFEYHIEVGRITWLAARFVTSRPDQRVVRYSVRRTFAWCGHSETADGTNRG